MDSLSKLTIKNRGKNKKMRVNLIVIVRILSPVTRKITSNMRKRRETLPAQICFKWWEGHRLLRQQPQ